MTTPRTHGLHHVTAISSDAQRTLDFYGGTLGLRLVKRTVNFDDPTTYHFYFGDATGAPGSILTFFPWPGARRGRQGLGQAAVTALAIPPASLGWWLDRLAARHVAHELPARRFADVDGGETVLALRDPDGMLLELVTDPRVAPLPGWTNGDVPAEHAIRGVHGVTLWVADGGPTGALLETRFGMRRAGTDGPTTRWVADDATLGRVVDVRRAEGFWEGASGAGTVHHVAFRVRDVAEELAVRDAVAGDGLHATDVVDRQYFESVYFRTPEGILFELATDAPGFATDESPEALGTALKLPPQYEPHRAAIEAALPPIALPAAEVAA